MPRPTTVGPAVASGRAREYAAESGHFAAAFVTISRRSCATRSAGTSAAAAIGDVAMANTSKGTNRKEEPPWRSESQHNGTADTGDARALPGMCEGRIHQRRVA